METHKFIIGRYSFWMDIKFLIWVGWYLGEGAVTAEILNKACDGQKS